MTTSTEAELDLARSERQLEEAKDELFTLERPGFSPAMASLIAEVQALRNMIIQHTGCPRVAMNDAIREAVSDMIAENS